ncbi:carbohydrate ABC transporter permease [Ructibacterium gallinarum]|uniref:Carbohydrate ABC transporter permease n=1 Tax=Ructibacterium gallinarum TaxID=2779355 RepID=A0A9D5M2L3_9FIRM|nr:carbohydrate ABC transporter permease [Ructibacterium gallinarum]MBE5040343.1 carbohydrate ABC transporter permease [Ructibacterium gallinarum]
MVERRSAGSLIFDICNVIILTLLSFICLYPMLYVLFASMSNPTEISQNAGILLWPKGFQLEAYKAVFQNDDIVSGYLNTLLYVIAGTSINMTLTVLGAYVLSRKDFKPRNFFMMYITITMFVSGGLVPSYLLVKNIGILNTRWAILLPTAINVFNLIMTRTYFLTIPDSLEEAAKIDGAGHWRILANVMLPLSTPILAVIGLYYMVGHWNSWFNAMIYLKDRNTWPLQLILREILILNESGSMMENTFTIDKLPIAENIKYAVIIVATVPILCVYPFLQKYFAKGVMVGAIKG